MNKTLFDFIENLAKEAARVGYKLRLEELDEIKVISRFVNDIVYISCELAKIQNMPCSTNFKGIAATLTEALDRMDVVTLADILEYELLNELEEVLHQFENGE
jgi:hypothetical protein